MRRPRAQPNPIVVNGVYDGDVKDFGDPNKMQSYIVEAEELERVIRVAKGRRFFVCARQTSVARDQSEATEGSTMGFKVYGHLIVSKEQALDFVKSAYTAKVREVSRVRMSLSNNSLFIG